MCTVSVWERGIALYKSDQSIIQHSAQTSSQTCTIKLALQHTPPWCWHDNTAQHTNIQHPQAVQPIPWCWHDNTKQHKHTAQTNGSTHTLMLAWQHNTTYQHSAQTSGPTPTLMLAWQHNTTYQHSAQTSGPTPTLMLAWLTAAPCWARKTPAAWLTLFAARCSRLLPAHHSTSLS